MTRKKEEERAKKGEQRALPALQEATWWTRREGERRERERGERERGAYATLTLYLQGCGGYLKITPNLKPLIPFKMVQPDQNGR